MANRYWVGGAGTWNVSSTTNWSASSGGSSGASVPTSADDVFINASSGTGNITLVGSTGTPITCKSLDTTGASSISIIAGSSTAYLDISGNFTIGSGTTVNGGLFTQLFRIVASGTVTINNTGNLLTNSFLQIRPGAGNTVTLGSNISLPYNNNTACFLLDSGTLDLGSYVATVTKFNTNTATAKAISASTGKFVLSGTPTGTANAWDVTNGGGTITFNNTINIDVTGTTNQIFVGGGKTYGTLSLGNTSTCTISDTGNTFGTITTLNTTNSRILSFAASTTNTVTTWSAGGSSGNVLTLNSDTAGTAATLAITNSSTVNYTIIQDVNLSVLNAATATNSNVINSNNWNIDTTSTRWAFLTSGTSWTPPIDWITTANNEIHVLGGGGGGSGSINTSIAGGAGGGGAGYTKATSITIVQGTSYTYAIGSAGAGAAGTTTISTGGTGGTSTFLVGSTTYTATGGTGGVANVTGPTSTAGTGGVGSNGSLNYTGGAGGIGAITGTTARPGGAGGGAAGPAGNGGKGGNGYVSGGVSSGSGGGGGNGGGTAGSDGTISAGGTGGNTALGVRIGGNGSTSVGGSNGINGIDIVTGIYGGGGGGGGGYANGGTAGSYGAGGGGAGTFNATVRTGGSGTQGAIFIGYAGTLTTKNSGFFFFM